MSVQGLHGLPVYVAAPFTRAAEVLAMHTQLAAVGCVPVSHWASLAQGTWEDLANASQRHIAAAIELNDTCVARAGAMLVMSYPGEGGEMFAEVARALALRCPILWTGPRLILSSFRQGVYLCYRDDALEALAHAARGCIFGGSISIARMRLHAYMRGKAERDAVA